jgi:hypothetical protein
MSFQIYIFFSLFFFIFSRTLDQSQLAQIDKLIEERLKSVKLDKFGIIIVNSSSIIHQKVFGEGITTKSHFPIASVTKSFTALGLLKLNIPLNQTIDKFNLGEYIKDDLAKQITVEELLSHSSGLDASSKKKVVEKGIFLYSNYGYGLLGKIIADQSKEKSYADFIKKNIMDELNMTESGLDYVNDFIDSYTNFFGSLSKYTNLESAYKKDDGFEIPAGFIRSSIEDMGKYLQGYFNINKDFLEKMGEPKTNINYNLYYGMGLFVRKKNGRYIYDHSGIINSFLTHMYIYPDDDLAYFVMTNTNDAQCPGPFFRFMTLLENLIVDDVIQYENTFTAFDSMDKVYSHLAIDLVIIILILIPCAYLVVTLIRKFKKKKPMWFDGIKGKIIFNVDLILLIILPGVLLATLLYSFKGTKDFLFCLIFVTCELVATFIIKLIYFIIYRKFLKNMDDDDLYNNIDKKNEIND